MWEIFSQVPAAVYAVVVVLAGFWVCVWYLGVERVFGPLWGTSKQGNADDDIYVIPQNREERFHLAEANQGADIDADTLRN